MTCSAWVCCHLKIRLTLCLFVEFLDHHTALSYFDYCLLFAHACIEYSRFCSASFLTSQHRSYYYLSLTLRYLRTGAFSSDFDFLMLYSLSICSYFLTLEACQQLQHEVRVLMEWKYWWWSVKSLMATCTSCIHLNTCCLPPPPATAKELHYATEFCWRSHF